MLEEQFVSGVFWYYNLPLSVRYVIQMNEKVDGDVLKRAMDTTMKRYPYLKKRVITSSTGYHIVENDLPVAVLETGDPVHLCDAQTNYHLFCVSYFDNIIFFDNSHALFDGRGRSNILHTLIYYYCKFKYNEEVEMPGVKLADSSIDPMEYDDPYTRPIPKAKVSLPLPPSPDNILYLPDMGCVWKEATQVHYLRINEKQLMSLCKTSDATPNTAVATLMCRAIAKIHPESDKTIAAGVYCDLREALRSPLTHKPLVTAPLLLFNKEMRDMDFAEQNTIFRGQLMLVTEESYLLKACEEQKIWSEKVQALPTCEEKVAAANKYWEDTVKGRTFAISYSGRSNFGSCSKYLKAFFPQVNAFTLGILIEITTADGWFNITFSQEWKEDIYFNGFLKEIQSLGIDYDLLFSSEQEKAIFPMSR